MITLLFVGIAMIGSILAGVGVQEVAGDLRSVREQIIVERWESVGRDCDLRYKLCLLSPRSLGVENCRAGHEECELRAFARFCATTQYHNKACHRRPGK